MSFNINATIIKSLLPIIEGKLTDENASKIFDEFLNKFPVGSNEVRNIITLTKESNGKVYLCVAGIDADNKITKVKKQSTLINAIKEILSYV